MSGQKKLKNKKKIGRPKEVGLPYGRSAGEGPIVIAKAELSACLVRAMPCATHFAWIHVDLFFVCFLLSLNNPKSSTLS